MRQLLSAHLRFWWIYYVPLSLFIVLADMMLLTPGQPVRLSLMWITLLMVPAVTQTMSRKARVLMALPLSRRTLGRAYWLLNVGLPALFLTASLPLSGWLHSPAIAIPALDLAVVLAGSLACAGAAYCFFLDWGSGRNSGEQTPTESVWTWDRPPHLSRLGAVWNFLAGAASSMWRAARKMFSGTVWMFLCLAGFFLPFWFTPSTQSLLPYLVVGVLGLVLPLVTWHRSESLFITRTRADFSPSQKSDDRASAELDEPSAPFYRFLGQVASALANAFLRSLFFLVLMVMERAPFGVTNFIWMVLMLTAADLEIEADGIRGLLIRHFQRALTGAVIVLVFVTMLHISLIGGNFLIVALLFGGLVGNPLFWNPLRVCRALPFSGFQLAATLMLLQSIGLLAMLPVWGTFQWLNQMHFLNGFTVSVLLVLLGFICLSNSISMFFGRKWWGAMLCAYLALWFGYILAQKMANHDGAALPSLPEMLLKLAGPVAWWVTGLLGILAAFYMTVILLRSSKPYRASRL
jgi:hypothetical protein